MDISAFVRVRTLNKALVAAGQSASDAGSICNKLILTFLCEANGFFLGKPFTALLLAKELDLATAIGDFWASLSFLPQFSENISRICVNEDVTVKLTDVAAIEWNSVSPDLLGSFYEYSLTREKQNADGVFYTSRENIHRVIDHLFVDELYNRLESCDGNREQLTELYSELCNLTFLDPACGGGNYLTETLIFLRSFETALMSELKQIGGATGRTVDYTKQIFGIEYDSGSASYARAALMLQNRICDIRQATVTETALRPILYAENKNIAVGDSLLMNWRAVAGDRISYIIGNPPFLYNKTQDQLDSMAAVFDESIDCNALDYCAAWVRKAAYLCGTGTACGFLTTSSICQGEQAVQLWRDITAEGTTINYAYRPFIWESDIDSFTPITQTYCTAFGFSSSAAKDKRLYESTRGTDKFTTVENISGYLEAMPDIYIEPKDEPMNCLPYLSRTTNQPDSIPEMEFRKLLSQGAREQDYLPYIHAKGTLYGKQLYCKVTDPELRKPQNYICFPRTSSCKREYIPIMYFENSALAFNEGVYRAANASLFHFGLLCSTMHNVWVKLLSGRLANNIRYSIRTVYNTLPIPEATEEEQKAISDAAAKILQLRSDKKKLTLAEMYDTMPADLRAAHMRLDFYVDKLYSPAPIATKEQRLNVLLKLYAEQEQPRHKI